MGWKYQIPTTITSIGWTIPKNINSKYKIPPIPTSMEWTQGIKVVQYRIGFLSGKYTHKVDKYKHWAYNSDDIQKYWFASLMTIANGSITSLLRICLPWRRLLHVIVAPEKEDDVKILFQKALIMDCS